jgi:hypothetical protein
MDTELKDFLSFRKMITPVIIQVLFWVGAAGMVIASLVTMVSSLTRYGNGIGGFFVGVLMLIIGPVMVRVYCELLILLFRMNETLIEIKNGLSKK